MKPDYVQVGDAIIGVKRSSIDAPFATLYSKDGFGSEASVLIPVGDAYTFLTAAQSMFFVLTGHKESQWIEPYNPEDLPEDDRRVLCLTETKAGRKNIMIGYYAKDLGRWVVGMSSNVIAWMYLPEIPED